MTLNPNPTPPTVCYPSPSPTCPIRPCDRACNVQIAQIQNTIDILSLLLAKVQSQLDDLQCCNELVDDCEDDCSSS